MSQLTRKEELELDAQKREEERATAIARFDQAVRREAEANRELGSAQCERANARNALGKVLCPKDAKDGEKFQIWHGARMLVVTKLAQHDFGIEERK